jgi:hypothetical protein
LEVSHDQVIAQAIKALCVGPLHNHLVREWPKIVVDLYEEFTKFSKSNVLDFRKLEEQRKAPKHDEASRSVCYNDNQHSYPKQVHNMTPMVVGLWKIGKRISGHLHKKETRGPLSTGQTSTIKEGVCQAEAMVEAKAHTHSSLSTACTMAVTPTTAQKIAPYL